jgi:hypothetical protein
MNDIIKAKYEVLKDCFTLLLYYLEDYFVPQGGGKAALAMT